MAGDWSIWTGSIQQNGHVSAIDNECHEEVDCNYNGFCENGECVCSDDVSNLLMLLCTIHQYGDTHFSLSFYSLDSILVPAVNTGQLVA